MVYCSHDTRSHGENGTWGDRGIDRRQFLRSAATATAVGVGGAAASGTAAVNHGTVASDSDYPRVTTRGHFDIHWWYGVQLTDGHTDTDYATAGTIPGVDTAAPAELVVSVHGWQNDADEAIGHFQDTSEALSANGYDAPVVGFSYDADTDVDDWWNAVEIADRNGPKLAAFLAGYADQNPHTTLRLVGHSLGAKVTLSTVETLNEWGLTDVVDSATLLGGAADATSVGLGGGYGNDIQAAVGRFDNFWKSDDQVLQWLYSSAEGMRAVGEVGCWGTQPANYTDHNVDYVTDHSSYNEVGDGCMAEVVATF